MNQTASLIAPPAPRPALQFVNSCEPVRVLHVVPSLHHGGMERSLVRLLEGFANHRTGQIEDGIAHGVCVLQGGDADLIGRCRALTATWVLGDESRRPARFRTARRLREAIASFGPDVVHARTTAVWLDAALATRRRNRTRLLLSFHGRTDLARPSWLRRRIHHWACRQADAVMTVSRGAANMIQQEWRVAGDKIHVVPNGVDTDLFQPPGPGRDDDRGDPAIRGSADHVVICVANLVEIKAIDVLLINWRRVVMADPRARLWLVGDGPLREPLSRLADDLRIAGTVRFLGRRDDVPQLLRVADLFVLPSRYEACPNAVLEAMATALPVVAFDVGGIRELVRPHHTGWLAPADSPNQLADTILAALFDRSARQRVGQAARRAIIEEHNLDGWVDQYAELYHHLVEGDSPACAE